MGMDAASVLRFRLRVENTLAGLFPATILVGGLPVSCSGPGGRIATEYVDGGEAITQRLSFRILKTVWPGGAPSVGMSLDWQAGGATIPLEITEVSNRPHDPAWHILTRQRKV